MHIHVYIHTWAFTWIYNITMDGQLLMSWIARLLDCSCRLGVPSITYLVQNVCLQASASAAGHSCVGQPVNHDPRVSGCVTARWHTKSWMASYSTS